MSNRCPKCGSYDTGTAYLNYVAKGASVVAKVGITAALTLLSGPGHGAHAAHEFMEKKEKNTVKGHICHHCGHEW